MFVTDRRTDGRTDSTRTDAWGKTICLPTLKGGDIIIASVHLLVEFLKAITQNTPTGINEKQKTQ